MDQTKRNRPCQADTFENARGGDQSTADFNIKPPSKAETVIATFLRYQSLNTFQAQAAYNDSCLHSSISYLGRRFGIYFSHERETVTNRVGRRVPVTRYHITDAARMEAVLSDLRSARGMTL